MFGSVSAVIVVSLLFYVLCVHGRKNISFDNLDEQQRCKNGTIEDREDGVYMCSNGEWMCLDKKIDAEITYVSSLNTDKIVSDFNRGVCFASLKREVGK